MQRVLIWAVLTLLTFLVFRNSFSTFFVQDDFILIHQFSQNRIDVDFEKAIGKPVVTHWRPLHNLYFLITGNLFGKTYQLYHLTNFLIHVFAAFAIYHVALTIFKKRFVSFLVAFFYSVNPLHFVSLFWISGGATELGFLFFITSFYYFLLKKYNFHLILFFISLLGSEAMIVGVPIFFAWTHLNNWPKKDQKMLFVVAAGSLVYIIVRFLFLTPINTFLSYNLSLSSGVIHTIRYYAVQTVGLGEKRDQISLFLILIFLFFCLVFAIRKLKMKEHIPLLVFFLSVIIAGLFPFIFLSNHLSPNYMNISCFGFSVFAAWLLNGENKLVVVLLCAMFLSASFKIVDTAQNNSWVVNKSQISRYFIEKIGQENLVPGSKIKFEDGEKYSSYDAYIALGTGEALNFWFSDKNYQTCFSFNENCE